MKTLDEQIKELRRAAILEALAETHNNVSAAAKLLGVHRVAFYRMIKAAGIQIEVTRRVRVKK